ncbi:MAG: hypothetical protein LUI14_07435 [Lachnospiraceae bacterium]|nr:hypothetical protein [Lachnospiraceae bacterium]
MNIEKYIKKKAAELLHSRRNVEIAPDINEAHVQQLSRKYSDVVSPDIYKFILVMSYTNTGVFL